LPVSGAERIANGNPVGSINPLVDLYNLISMKCGGETLDAIQGDLVLEQVDGTRSRDLEAALAELGERIRTRLGGRTEPHVVKGAGRIDLAP